MSFFYKKISAPNHDTVKSLVLTAIDSFAEAEQFGDVANTDWHLPQHITRPYQSPISTFLYWPLVAEYCAMGGTNLEVVTCWFQQYNSGDIHHWHNHPGVHFTNIYYVEYPDGSPQTEFIDPENPKNIIKIDVKEGDILIVPAHVIHQSPSVTTSFGRKTVVVLNTNLLYRPDQP
jgi:hypothetical protein